MSVGNWDEEKRRGRRLKLFEPEGPVDNLTMNIFGPFTRKKSGSWFILVIADRCTKLAIAVSLSKTTTRDIAKRPLDAWNFLYVVLEEPLTNNGAQLVSKFSNFINEVLGMVQRMRTSYHPRTDVHTEWFRWTLVSGLRHYVAEHQQDWDE